MNHVEYCVQRKLADGEWELPCIEYDTYDEAASMLRVLQYVYPHHQYRVSVRKVTPWCECRKAVAP